MVGPPCLRGSCAGHLVPRSLGHPGLPKSRQVAGLWRPGIGQGPPGTSARPAGLMWLPGRNGASRKGALRGLGLRSRPRGWTSCVWELSLGCRGPRSLRPDGAGTWPSVLGRGPLCLSLPPSRLPASLTDPSSAWDPGSVSHGRGVRTRRAFCPRGPLGPSFLPGLTRPTPTDFTTTRNQPAA